MSKNTPPLPRLMSRQSRRLRLIASTPLAWALLHAPLALAAPGHDDTHGSAHNGADGGDIVVAGHPPVDFGLLAGATALAGDDLVANTRGQLGETLARLPGVSATSFAPGVSRPVLRGFDGDRIRVLVDGIGSIDASNVSADHAVVFDPLTTDHIDILHGPAVLLFGGQAIGGAVNALDHRIPRRVPEKPEINAIASYGSAADERAIGGALEVPLADRLAFHADASWRKSDDLRTGGLINSAPLRADLLDDAASHRAAGETAEAEELEELADLSGRIPNSGARSYTLGAGLAFIDAGGNLGISFQRYDSRYGVPMRPGAAHGHADEAAGPDEAAPADEAHGDAPVAIGLVQTRIDLRGAINLGGMFDSLQVRGAYGDYAHTEFEGNAAGTRFAGKGVEFRADLVQANHNGWRGRSGVQYFSRRMTIVGAEAFVPNNDVNRFGVFTLQSLRLGAGFEVEAAGRYERTNIRSDNVGFRRGFDQWSGAAGLSFAPADGWKLGVNYIRGARAPAPEELLSNGMHVATQSYEVGDAAFGVETSDGFEAYVRHDGDRLSLALTGYLTDFDAFITAMPTGAITDGLPEFRYSQVPARFKGFEASARYDAVRWANGALTLEGGADYTHAEIKGTGPVPRIPPLRLRGGAEVRQGALRLHGEVEWNRRQNRVATFENPVPAFTLVNLGADWHPLGEDGPLTLMLSANNLFDVVGRRAASFTRDFVPIAGRDIRLTAKISL